MVVSSEIENGAVTSVETVVQVPVPTGARWKSTSVVSGSDDAVNVTVPRRYCAGSSSVGAGERLSTVIVRTAEVVLLPAISVTTTSIAAVPSAPEVESHVMSYGALVSVANSVPRT